jgi:predicted TIM-barrel fold metal-dependent hydrolase
MATRERTRYRLISADSHVNEPPDLWTARVPQRFVDRAPRIESFPEGDAWVLEGVDDPINFGMNACAGLAPEDMTAWKRFDEIRPGGHDPAARLEEMDEDAVDAEVVYPTPRLSQAVFAYQEPAFHHALVQAYNDWLSEYVGYAPARFAGLALVPNRGADDAVDEIRRVQDRTGIRGFLMGCYPNGTLEVMPEDDTVFGYLAEADIPLSIHVSLTQAMPSAHRSPLPGYGRFFDAPNRIVQMIFAGVFDRFPDLRVVIAEVDCGWVPYYKEQIDNNYQRLLATSDFSIAELPSVYVDRNVRFTFLTDPFGIRSRYDVGVENMLWSSDYPHISADWPYSWRSIQTAMSGVPHDERELMLAGNAVKLYGF